MAENNFDLTKRFDCIEYDFFSDGIHLVGKKVGETIRYGIYSSNINEMLFECIYNYFKEIERKGYKQAMDLYHDYPEKCILMCRGVHQTVVNKEQFISPLKQFEYRHVPDDAIKL